MHLEWPHVEKLIPLPVCLGLVGMVLAAFVVLLIVLATTTRRRERESD